MHKRYLILLLIYTIKVLNCISQSQDVNDNLEKLISKTSLIELELRFWVTWHETILL